MLGPLLSEASMDITKEAFWVGIALGIVIGFCVRDLIVPLALRIKHRLHGR